MNNELWRAIYELHKLLQRGDEVPEDEIQAYFEANSIVFGVLGFDNAKPYEKSSGNRLPYDEEAGTQREPDFICIEGKTKTATVLELKTPELRPMTTSQAGRRTKLRAFLSTYIAQTTEYVKFIANNREARKAICSTFGIDEVKQVRGILVYGLSTSDDPALVSEKVAEQSTRLEILHFDDLFAQLLGHYAIGRSDVAISEDTGDLRRFSGLVLGLDIVLPGTQELPKAYLIDVGCPSEDRVSVFIEDGRLVVELRDADERKLRAECTPELNLPLHILLEASNEDDAGFVSVFLNNREIEFWQRSSGANVQPDPWKVVVGADHSGKNGAIFRSIQFYWSDLTLGPLGRITAYDDFLEKTSRAGEINCAEFLVGSYMRRVAKGIIQEDESKRPIFRKLKSYAFEE